MKRMIRPFTLSFPRGGTAARLAGLVAALTLPVLALPAAAEVVATPGGIRFSHVAPNASTVQIAGSFNSWTGEPMDREADGTWSRVVRLGPGPHEYKFVVDGQWIADPDNPVTLGDYGNSAFTLGADGKLAAMEEVSNTPYNARFFITGRTIALYDSYKNDEADGRFELRRPNFDTDLNFAVRVNDVMEARILTNINNESENIESFRTRLNFDRGMLHFTTEDLEGWAWDNDAIEDWDDPLALVGNVGIYDHSFGYDTQGAMLGRGFRGAQVKLLYADNFVDGGQNRPSLDAFFSAEAGAGDLAFAQLGADSLFAFRAGLDRFYRFNLTAGDEDVLATRATYRWDDLTFGLSGRLDRGYNPGSVGILEDVTPATMAVDTGDPAVPDSVAIPGFTATRRTFEGTEKWFGVGGDVRWNDLAERVDVEVEVLYGKAQVAARNGLEQRVFLGTAADTASGAPLAAFAPLTDAEEIGGDTFDLDESLRLHLGFSGLPELLGARLTTSVQFERHDLTSLATGLAGDITNDVYRWDAHVERPSRIADRAVLPSLGVEFHYFDYDPSSPWEYQPWFDYRNFWLETGEHDVKFERLTLLGGADALILRPALEVEVLASPRVTFRYDGTIAGPGFGREPSYVETLLQGTWQFRPRWRFHTDLRFAKYNSRPLDLNGSYNETFLEVAYEVAEGIELALSYGVDPWAIDDPVNEYAYIGRDLYLFGRDANGATARTNYVSLAELIPEAESALADERVIQIEAVVRF